jgi:hypothetical protein
MSPTVHTGTKNHRRHGASPRPVEILLDGSSAGSIDRNQTIELHGKVTMNWDLRHRKSSLVIRLLLAVWITVVVVVLCATGRWWGLAFVAPLLVDLYLLRRILVTGSGR